MKTPHIYLSHQMDEIQDFITKTYGGTEEGLIGHEIESEYVHTDVCGLTDHDGDRCFVTFGMGARAMNSPIPGMDRVELLMYATEATEVSSPEGLLIMGELQRLSKFPFRNDTFFGPGHTIDASDEFQKRFGFDAFVFVPSHSTSLSGVGDVQFLLAIPIYQAEREAMMRGHSFDVLKQLEQTYGAWVYYVDSERESVEI